MSLPCRMLHENREASVRWGAERRTRLRSHSFAIHAFTLLLVLTIPLLLATVTSAASSDEGFPENEVKAAILYNLAEFVTWPEQALSAGNPRLVVCLFNKPDFQLNFEVFQGQPLKNRSLDIRKIHYEHELDNCHVVFLSIKSIKKDKPILAAVSRSTYSPSATFLSLHAKEE